MTTKVRILAFLLLILVGLTSCQITHGQEPSEEASKETSVEEPSVEEPSVEEPSVEEPSVEESSVEEPSEEAFGEISIEVSDEVSLPLYGDPLVPLEGWSVGYLTYDLLTGELLTGGNMDQKFKIPPSLGLPAEASAKELLSFYLATPETLGEGSTSFTEKAFKGSLGPFKAIFSAADKNSLVELDVLTDEEGQPQTLVLCLAEMPGQVKEREILKTIVDVYFTILGGPYPEF